MSYLAKLGVILLLALLGAILSLIVSFPAWIFIGLMTGNIGGQGDLRNNWGAALLWFRILPPVLGVALGVYIGGLIPREPTNKWVNGSNHGQDTKPPSDDWSK